MSFAVRFTVRLAFVQKREPLLCKGALYYHGSSQTQSYPEIFFPEIREKTLARHDGAARAQSNALGREDGP
jgi:hypothetical protein